MDVIHVAGQEELDKCLKIRMEVFVDEQGVPAEEEVDEFDELGGSCRHFLIMLDGEEAAAARWRPYGEGQAKMQRIAVRQRYRGLGIGAKLLLALEEDARLCGKRESVLDAQCQAENFYRKLGYMTVSAEPFDDAGIPHVRMVKSIL